MGARVLLADDHALVRTGIRALLESSGVEVVGEASSAEETVTLVKNLDPDVVFVDVSMGATSGIEAARALRESAPRTRVVILSMHAEPQYVQESIEAGASGYVLKEQAFEDVLRAIDVVLAGGRYLSPRATRVETAPVARERPSTLPGVEVLTAREREVLKLVAEGYSSVEIGRMLFISARTVDTHRKNIMEKVGIRSIAGLTRFAVRSGLCSLDESS